LRETGKSPDIQNTQGEQPDGNQNTGKDSSHFVGRFNVSVALSGRCSVDREDTQRLYHTVCELRYT
jgi:hypothetical protein